MGSLGRKGILIAGGGVMSLGSMGVSRRRGMEADWAVRVVGSLKTCRAMVSK